METLNITTFVKIHVSFYHPSKISTQSLKMMGGEEYIDKLNKDGEKRMKKAKLLGLKGNKKREGEFEFTGEIQGTYEEVFRFINREFEGRGACVANPVYGN